jgi:hypothetical protein
MNEAEAEAKAYLERELGRPLTKLGYYHRMDFHEPVSDLFIEFKSRTNPKDKYPTTMVGEGKVRWLRTHAKRGLFVFGFTDGYFCIRYDPAQFDTFEVRDGGRYDRGGPEISKYCYIPVSALSPIARLPLESNVSA